MNAHQFEEFQVLDRYSDVAFFLPHVAEAADANRNALGFFPASVYLEYAQRDRLFVLIKNSIKGKVYAGHLLFRPCYPRTHVLQMTTKFAFRRQGCAKKLLEHLVDTLTKGGFTSIYARVGEDMTDSNHFWDQQHFYVQGIKKGGSTRNRQIIVRVRELASPQLFPSSGISGDNPLGLLAAVPDIPLFLLDLNVLFDLGPRRARNDDAISLFRAQQMNFCRLAISTEISEELRRTAHQGKTDPMEAFTHTFPVYPLLKDNVALVNDLAALIFPERNEKMRLTANDRSDLQHVAITIQNDLAGLITNDAAILNAAPLIEAKYGIEIISSAAFKFDGFGASSNSEFDTTAGGTLILQDINKSHEVAVHTLLATTLGLSGSTIANGWLSPDGPNRISRSCGVFNVDTLIGYASWSAKSVAGALITRIAIDEFDPQALNAARILLIFMLKELAAKEPQQVRLELPPNQSHTRELAASFGFSASGNQQCLNKIILGRVMTIRTWDAAQKALASKNNLKLPLSIPQYRNANQHIRIFTPDGNQRHASLDVLETLLSPALFCLPGRPAVIVPIQQKFATPLLGATPQVSLLPNTTSSLYQDRHYLSDSKTLRHFKKGTLILFYESTKQNGRAAIIAIARVQEAYLKSVDTIHTDDLAQSVLTVKSVQEIGKAKMRTVTVFDNLFLLLHPVPLISLQRLGCGKSNQLISAQAITDMQLQAILDEGFQHEQ